MNSPAGLGRLQRSTGIPLLLDGAMGTELARRGIAIPAPLWSTAGLIEAPSVVERIHRDYTAAGADILVANTFRTNPAALAAGGLIRLVSEHQFVFARRANETPTGRYSHLVPNWLSTSDRSAISTFESWSIFPAMSHATPVCPNRARTIAIS
ncbi:MAG: homocysteine S-methyltransferase family protein [Phycisphaerales bacterium]|nr:homocysteine S-methyltransferase family protein [Phycisphaerales bacterium]